jgi:hypothetical protein
MQPCGMAAAIGVKDKPEIADQVLLEHKDMMPPHGDPTWTRRRAREAKPVRREPKLTDRPAENADRRAAAAERPGRTAGRMRQDDGARDAQGSPRSGRGLQWWFLTDSQLFR